MLLTARTAPAGFPLTVRDLVSRLRALPGVTLAPPDDALLRALIVKLSADRQLAVDETLVNYLANRVERSFAAARAAVIAARPGGDAPASSGDAGTGRRNLPRPNFLTTRTTMA